jgi:hypothetical protein
MRGNPQCCLGHFRPWSGNICDFWTSLREFFEPVVNHFTRQTLPTINRKHFYGILCIESFCPQKKKQNRTLFLCSTSLKHGRHFDYWHLPVNMRMLVCYLDCHEAGLCCYLLILIENSMIVRQYILYTQEPLKKQCRQNRYSTITPPRGTLYIHNIKYEYPSPRMNNLRVITRITSVAQPRFWGEIPARSYPTSQLSLPQQNNQQHIYGCVAVTKLVVNTVIAILILIVFVVMSSFNYILTTFKLKCVC